MVDPLSNRRPMRRADLPSLAFVEFVFLPELVRRGGLSAFEEQRSLALVQELAAEATWQAPAAGLPGVSPVTSPPLAGVAPTLPTGWTPPTTAHSTPPRAADSAPMPGTLGFPGTASHPAPLAGAARQPGSVARWWLRTRESVGSDLAVHGLAYLGVLLFFVGAFGLVAFAFGDVERSLRPVAEVVIAGAPFAAAALLLRRGAVIVGRALEVIGGLLLPVMVTTSFLDGVGFPPELDGTALVVAVTLSCAALAIGYALWSYRHPASGLRYVVAPMVWFTAAMGGLGIGRPVPHGQDVATPSAAQVALTLVAVLLTVAWARWRPHNLLAGPSLTSAVPGACILGGLGVLTWMASAAPDVAAVLVSGVAGLATLELLGLPHAAPGAEPTPRPARQPSTGATGSDPGEPRGNAPATPAPAQLAPATPAPAQLAPALLAPAQLAPAPPVPAPPAAAPPVHDRFGSAPLGRRVLGVVEPLWWLAVALALVPGLGQPWSGAITAVGSLAILELAAHARRPGWALAAPAALASVGALSMSGQPQPQAWLTVAVLAAASVWAIWRRTRPFDVDHAPLVLDVAAALLPAATVLAVASAASAPVSVVTAACLVLLATLPATRPLLDRGPDDTFWPRWWQVAMAVVASSCALLWTVPQAGADVPALTTGDQWLLIGAITTLVVASAWGPIPRLARPWLLAGLSTWAWTLACAAATIPDAVRGSIPSALALLVVLVAHAPRRSPATPRVTTVAPARRWTAGADRQHAGGRWARGIGVAGSAGLAAHTVALVAIGLGGAGWGALVTVGLATAGFAVTTGFDAWRTSPVVDALGAVHPLLRPLPLILAAVGIPLTTLQALDVAGVDSWTAAPTATVLAVWALVYALLARLVIEPRLQRPLAWTAFATGLCAAAAGRQGWPLVLGLAALIAVVCLLPAGRRATAMVWVAWAAVAPLAAATLTQAWSSFAALAPQVRASATLIGVGGVMLVGAAAADLASGPRLPRWRPRRAALHPVAALGAVEVATGGLLATATTTGVTLGWFLVALAVVTLATAALASAGVLGGVGVVLAWAGAALLVGPDATVPTWLGVVCVGALIALSELARRVVGDRCWWSRWDVPLLVAAAPVAVTTLAASGPGAPAAAATAALGLEVLVVAVLWRDQRLVPALLGPLGTALVLQGAATAGGYWLAIALAGLSITLTVLAARSTGMLRGWLQVGGALAAAAAWVEVLATVHWPPQAELNVTVLGAAVVTMTLAGVAWTRQVARSWLLAWSVTAAAVVGAAGLLAHTHVVDAEPSPAVVLALGLVAAAAFLAAAPLRLAWLRDVGVLWTTAAVLSGMTVWQAAARTQVMVLGGASVALAVLLLAVATRAGSWRRTIVELGLVSVLTAVAVAVMAGDAALIAAALAVAAVQAAACGAILELLWVQALSPVLACAAWLVFASGSLPDDPQWWAMPIGLALLAVVGLWRGDRGRRGLPLATAPIVAVELAGVTFLVGAWVVQAVVSSLAYTLPLLLLGALVATWGVVTRVRRRVGEGAAVVLCAVILVVAVPLVHLLPSWGGAGLWILIAGIGITAVLVASLLEQGRAAVRRSRERFAQVTADWE